MAIWFALSLIPFTVVIGSSFDYVRASTYRAKLQQVTDATVLAAAQVAGSMNDNQLRDYATGYLRSMSNNPEARIESLTISNARSQLHIKASMNVPKTFSRILHAVDGSNDIPVTVESATMMATSTFEIVMVLDNSGSMSGQKIADLKTAANQLVSVMFNGEPRWDRGHIGIVPFTLAVNVGSTNEGAAWLDPDAASPAHWRNFAFPASARPADLPKNRFELFKWLNVKWAGCVEQRPYPYNVTDVPPSSSVPSTLFVPMFAPDEPDTFSSWTMLDNGQYKRNYYPTSTTNRSYWNNYLDDFGGECTDDFNDPHAVADREQRRGNRQGMVCKYKGPQGAKWIDNRNNRGPNMQCDASPLVALTNQRGPLEASINGMVAGGNTNILEGVMWGWRVLSPEAPFTEGKPWGEPNHHKIMIVMTDGENYLNTGNYDNKSSYSPFGHLADAQDRLGISEGGMSQVRSRMDTMTTEACNGAKGKGIQIYTIALGVTDQKNLELLRNCATTKDMAYTTASSSDLVSIFDSIARNIGQLRLTQ
jgi:Mg-chelatase subunit ChlD